MRVRGRVVLLVAALLTACGPRSDVRSPDASDLLTITHDGRTRSYLLRLPESAASSDSLPLVLVLHGAGGNAFNAETMTGFTRLARAEGFIVAYPEGSARRGRLLTWNAGHCCSYAMKERVDDVGFIRALIDHLVRRYPVDPRRIYIAGMSNGAMMAHRAGLELGGTVAAIAPVVGTVFGDESRTGPPVSAIMINGMLDRLVPYDGGAPGGPVPRAWDVSATQPAEAQAVLWAERNGCSSPTTSDRAAYVHVRYSCGAGLAVELYGVKDNGHAWPGGERGSRRGDAPSRSLDATRVIWEFFAAHPKR